MDNHVAVVFMRPAMSVPVEVGPGRTINFHGGYAEVADPSALPALLCRPDLTILLTERYRDHLPLWLEGLTRAVRKPQARVQLPNGRYLEPPTYAAPPEEDDAPEEPAEDAPAPAAAEPEPVTAGWTPREQRSDGD